MFDNVTSRELQVEIDRLIDYRDKLAIHFNHEIETVRGVLKNVIRNQSNFNSAIQEEIIDLRKQFQNYTDEMNRRLEDVEKVQK